MFERVGKRLRTRPDRHRIALSASLQKLPMPLHAVGQNQRRAAERDVVHPRVQKIFKSGIELLPRSLDLARLLDDLDVDLQFDFDPDQLPDNDQ